MTTPRHPSIFTSAATAALLVSIHTVSAGELDNAWTAHQSALATHQTAHADLNDKVDGLIAIDKDLKKASADLVAQNEIYYAALDGYYSIMGKLESRYAERLIAAAAPEALSAERRELQRQWDILLPYRNYVEDAFFDDLNRRLRQTTRAVAKAREEGRAKIANEIDPAIEGLKEERDNAFRKMTDVMEISFDRTLTRKWFEAALAYNAADKKYAETAANLDQRYAAYVKILRDAPPVFLQKIDVTSNGQRLYDFVWVRDGYVDDTQASVDYARDKKALENGIPSSERVLKTVTLERAQGNVFRLDLARRMHAMNDDLMQNAEDYRDAVWNKELALFVTEVVLVITESALTGGTATAARKASELAERVAETGAAKSRKLIRNRRNMDPRAIRQRLEDALEGPARERLKELAGEAAKKRAAHIARRADLEALVLLNKRYGESFQTISEAAQKVPRSTLNRLMRESKQSLRKQARDLFPDPDPKDFLDPEKARKLWQRLRPEPSSFDDLDPGRALGKYPDYAASGGWNQDYGLVPMAKRTDGSAIFQGEAVEWAISSGVNGVAEIAQGIAEQKGLIQPSQLTKLSWSQAATVNAAFSIVDASTKTIISSYYEDEINDAYIKFWSIYAQMSAIYSVYATSLAEDKELFDIEMDTRRGLRRAKAFLTEIGLPRRPKGAQMDALPITDEMNSVNLNLTFSSPLSAPPIVKLAGETLSATGKGRNWKVVFSPTIAMRSSETETLSVSVSANSTPFASLDTNPETIAWMPLNKNDWQGFERGADTRHKLRFKPAKPAVLKVKVDGVSAQIELR